MFTFKTPLSCLLLAFVFCSSITHAECLDAQDTNVALCETSEVLYQTGEASIIQDKAQVLGSAAAIYEYVRNNTEYVAYHGARSNSLNSFLSMRGNNVDLATTLIALYRSVGIPARYVVGNVELSSDDISNWTDITNPSLAVFNLSNQGIRVFSRSNPEKIIFEHVWVEALVNFAGYRGGQKTETRCTQEGNGCQWVALDPSFKRLRFPSDEKPEGRSFYRNLLTNVNFDYDAYYRAESQQSLRDKHPLEIFEENALTYLRQNHPGITLDDVMDKGNIITEELGFLPSSLPYNVLGDQRRYYSIADHDTAHQSSIEPAAWTKYVKVSLYPVVNGVECRASNINFGATATVADLGTKRFTINWGQFGGQLKLAFRLDGEEIGVGLQNSVINCGAGSEEFKLGSRFNVELSIDGSPNRQPAITRDDDLVVGGYYLVATGGETSNWSQVQRAYGQLLQSSEDNPLLIDPQGKVYVDRDKDGIISSADSLLLESQKVQDVLTGGLLYAAQGHYYTHFRERVKRYNRLKNVITPIDAFGGLISSQYSVESVNTTPFAVVPAGLLIDLGGIRFNGSWQADEEEQFLNDAIKFIGHVGSSLEHEVWQELTGQDAISTMRGIQLSLKEGASLLDVDKNSYESALLSMGVNRSPVAGFAQKEYNLFGKRLVAWDYSGNNPNQSMLVFRGNVDGRSSTDEESQVSVINSSGALSNNLNVFDNIENQLITLKNTPPTALYTRTYNLSVIGGVVSGKITSPSGYVVDSFDQFELNTVKFVIRETVSHVGSTNNLNLQVHLRGGTFPFNVTLSFSSPVPPTPEYNLSCNSNGTSRKATAAVLLGFWQNCFNHFVSSNNLTNTIDRFDRNKGFNPSNYFYKSTVPSLEEHDFSVVSQMRSDFYFSDDDSVDSTYVIPSKTTLGDTYLFAVYVNDRIEKNTGRLSGSTYAITNQGGRLVAGGGYVPEGLGIDPVNNTQDVTINNPGPNQSLDTSQVDFNNEVFTDRNLVSIANNDPVRTPSTADPVSTVTGNMYHDETDFVIAGKGLNYVFTRTYNSNKTTTDGPDSINPNYLPISQGWTHSYNMKLVSNDYGQYPNYGSNLSPENANNKTSSITYVDERGGEYNYLLDDSSATSQPTAPRASFDRLQLDTPSVGLHTMTWRNGVQYIFDSRITGQGSGGEGSDLRTPGIQARLFQILDPYGQQLQLNYNSNNQLVTITDNINQTARTGLTFAYYTDGQANGRLHTITDWAGRTWRYTYDAQGQLISVSDPLNQAMEYTYVDDTHWLKDIIHPADRSGKRKTMTFSYYHNGQAHDYIDQLSQRESVTYDLYRRRTRITNPRDYVTEHYYTQNGTLEKLVQPDNAILLFDDNKDGLRYLKRNGLGFTTRYAYNTARTLDGAASDTFGQVTREQDALGYQQDYDYGIYDQVIRIKDKNGNVFENEYYQTTDTAQGAIAGRLKQTRMVSVTVNGVARSNVVMSEYRYHADGTLKQKIEFIDPAQPTRQRVTDYTYQYNTDGSYQLTTEVSASGTSTVIRQVQQFDPLWRLVSSTQYRQKSVLDASEIALTTTYEYDALGRLIRTTDPLGNIQETEYDANDQITRSIARYLKNSGSAQTPTPRYSQCTQDAAYPNHDTCVLLTHTYDLADRLVKTANILGATIEYTYDEMGNVLSTKNSLGHQLRYQYDSMGRATQVTNENGYTLKTEYDLAGRVTKITDANNNAVRYTYDALGRRLSSTSPQGRVIRFDQYDANGNLLNVSDANAVANQQPINTQNASISNAFDEFNRLVSTLNANNEITQYTYDLLGNRTSIIDAKGQVTQFIYDDLGRLAEVIDPLVETPTDKTASVRYDSLGNQIAYTDRNGHTTHLYYDALNRLTQKDYLHDATSEVFQYDHYGHLVQVENADVTYRYVYDVAGRMLSKTDTRQHQPSRTLQWSYDVVGNVLSKTNYEGEEQRFTYDSTNRLIQAALHNAQGQLQIQASYQYDPAGRLLSRILSNGSASLYDNDKDGFLTRLRQLNAANQLVQDRQYQYDQVGNITQISNTYPTSISTTQTDTIDYVYDGSYRLLNADHSDNQYDIAYTYDQVGNRLSKTQAGATQHYHYGIGNRLHSVRDNNITGPVRYQFAYDDNGSLIEKRDGSNNLLLQLTYDQRRLANSISTNTNNNNQNLSFVYDPNAYRIGKQTPQGEKRYYLEGEHLESTYDENNDLLAKYLRGAVIDEVISAHHKNPDNDKLQQRTYHHGQVNSVSLLTNHNGETVQRITYGPFGEPLTISGSDNNTLRYTGRELDALTGLYYYRARYYDPDLGRFISEDPIGFNGGINFYAYVENNPLIYNDPTGNCPTCITAGIGALLGGGAVLVGDLIRGEGFSSPSTYAGAIVGGAVAGALLNPALAASTLPTLGAAGAGAAGGLANTTVKQVGRVNFEGKEYSASEALLDTTLSAAFTGGASAIVSRYIGSTVRPTLPSLIAAEQASAGSNIGASGSALYTALGNTQTVPSLLAAETAFGAATATADNLTNTAVLNYLQDGGFSIYSSQPNTVTPASQAYAKP